jgi:hypothetical protein
MQTQQILAIALAAVFFAVMFIWGVILTTGLRGGDESQAATGTAFITIAIITLGDALLTHYKIARPDSSPAYLFRFSKIAAAVFGGLFVCFVVIGGLIEGYRAMLLFRAISYGFLGLLVVYMSDAYLHFRLAGADHTLLGTAT